MISALAQEKISRHTLEDDMLLMHPEWEPGSIATKINAGMRLRKLCTDAEWYGLDLEDKRSNK